MPRIFWRTLLLWFTLVFASTAKAQEALTTKPLLVSQLFPVHHLLMTAKAKCSLPWGGTITEGESVTAYSSTTPASLCSNNSETRTCNSNGTLSGSYQSQSCTSGCASTPWGAISHGSSNTAYSTTSPSASTTCASVSELRTCNNGTLSGSYANTTCLNVIVASGSGANMNVTGPGNPAYGSNVQFTFQNVGNIYTASMSVSLSNTTNFEQVSSTCTGVLAPNATCSVTVRPKATANGSLSGNLTLNW